MVLGSFNLQDSLNYLIDLGVYDVLLPFLLVFAIVFATLEKTAILGKDKSNINAIVAVVTGLLLVVQRGIVDTINIFLPRISLLIVVILMGLLVISMIAGKEFDGIKGGSFAIGVIIIIIAVIFSLVTPQSGGPIWLTPADKQILLSVGILILVLVLVIGLVTSKPKQQQGDSFLKKLAKDFGGKE